MDPRAFAANVAAIGVSMALLVAAEAALPLFVRPAGRRRIGAVNVRLMLVNVAANWLLLTGAAFLALAGSREPDGLLARLTVPFGAQVALGVIVLDFGYGYLAHRLMHRIPFLWRVHRVHHSDPFVDVTTSYRNHPFESLWRQLFVAGPVVVLGLPPEAVVLHRLLSVVNAALEHANVRVWTSLDRALVWLWVTPDMHKLHHSRDQRETDSNYGNLFPWFDHALATYTPTARVAGVRYGLDDAPEARAATVRALLAAPFAAARDTGGTVSDALPVTAPRT